MLSCFSKRREFGSPPLVCLCLERRRINLRIASCNERFEVPLADHWCTQAVALAAPRLCDAQQQINRLSLERSERPYDEAQETCRRPPSF